MNFGHGVDKFQSLLPRQVGDRQHPQLFTLLAAKTTRQKTRLFWT